MATEPTPDQVLDTPPAPVVDANPPAPAAPSAPSAKGSKTLDNPLERAQALFGVPDNTPSPANPPTDQPVVQPQSGKPNEPQKDPAAGNHPSSTPAPQLDFNPAYFQEKLGIELSEDELKERLAAHDQLTALQAQEQQWQDKIKQLEEQVASSKIEDPYVLKLHELRKGGATPEQIKAFNKASELGDLSTLNNNDKLKLHLQLDKGMDDRTAEAHIRRYMKLTEPKEDDFDDKDNYNDAMDEYLLSMSEYSEKVKGAETFLKQFVQSASNPSSPNSEAFIAQQQAQAKYAEDVQKVVPSVISQLDKISVNINTGTETKMFDMPLDAEFKKQAPELLKNFFNNHNVPLTQEGIQSALNYLTAEAKLNAFDKAISNSYNQGASAKEQQMRAEYDRNGAFVRPNAQAPDPNAGNEFETWKRNRITQPA